MTTQEGFNFLQEGDVLCRDVARYDTPKILKFKVVRVTDKYAYISDGTRFHRKSMPYKATAFRSTQLKLDYFIETEETKSEEQAQLFKEEVEFFFDSFKRAATFEQKVEIFNKYKTNSCNNQKEQKP